MDDNEELIEEARRAYLDAWAATNLEDVPPGTRSRNGIIAALAVFEKAQGEPSDAQVEGGCVAFYEGAQGITSWARLAETDPQLANRYRDGIRAALRAAGGAQ